MNPVGVRRMQEVARQKKSFNEGVVELKKGTKLKEELPLRPLRNQGPVADSRLVTKFSRYAERKLNQGGGVGPVGWKERRDFNNLVSIRGGSPRKTDVKPSNLKGLARG